MGAWIGLMAAICLHGSGPSGHIKCGEFLD
jgi:hypothetical protein